VLTERLEFAPERDAEIFSAVPAAPAVFLLRGTDDKAEPYVSKTANLRRRLQRLLGPVEERTKRLNLRDRVREIEYSPTGSDFESGFLLYGVLRAAFPKTYSNRMRFRFAPLVKLHLENEYPRASITTRLGRLGGRSLYYGPFVSRIPAEKFMNDSLDFFKMRRCVDDLHPDPKFPGCIYSEMKMCLAPCFKGCTDEAYAAEVARVREFFQSGGQSLRRETERLRDEASANLDFEGAAALHARLDKVKAVIAQVPDIVRRLDELDGVMIQPSADADSVTLFKIAGGSICDPVTLDFGKQAEASQVGSKPQSMESRITQALAAVAEPKLRNALEWMEHLALLKRWYYRTSKIGELFLTENGELPMRRVVRGVSRVFRGEKAVADLSETAGDYWQFRAREAGLSDK